ncbi:MAG: S8 family serine peptidase [Candidatus Bathyarchaeota archaeon]|nr:S8 family serine peptidase [Candidatus Bathyarchaeota archaeon]
MRLELKSLSLILCIMLIASTANIIPISYSQENPEETTVWDGSVTTPKGEKLSIEKVKKGEEKLTLYTDDSGNTYTKEEFSQKLAQEESKLDTELSQQLLTRSPTSEKVRVIVVLEDQPQYEAFQNKKEQYKESIQAESEKIRDVYKRIRTDYLEEYGSLPEGREGLAAIAEFEQNNLTEEEKHMMNQSRQTVDQLLTQMRREALTQGETLIQNSRATDGTLDFIQSVGGEIKHEYTIFNGFTAEIQLEKVQELADRPEVAKIILDKKMSAQLYDSPYTIWADAYWGEGLTGGPFDIGIVDSGVDDTHPALSGHTFYETTYADIDGDGIADEDEDDYNGHGTAVCGIVSSVDPTYGGVAYGHDAVFNAKAANSEGWMWRSDAMEAFEWAIFGIDDDGADIFPYSYGSTSGGGDTPWSQFFDALVDDLDIPIAVIAGNSGPTEYTLWEPGNNFNAITVGYTDDMDTGLDRTDDILDSTSSRGPTTDGRKKPDLTAPGSYITTTTHDWEGANPDFSQVSGSSFAAPHVAGAMLLAYDWGLYDPMMIKAMMINSAEKRVSEAWDPGWGWGYVELYNLKYTTDGWWGYLYDSPVYGTDYYDFYVGPITTGTYEPHDRATLVWNRHAEYSGPHYPYAYDVSDLDLSLYDLSGNLRDYSYSAYDNVEQVISPFDGTGILKVEEYDMTDRPDVGEYEPYALALPYGWTTATSPTVDVYFTSTPSTVEVGDTFWLYVDVYNDGDIPAHNVEVTLSLPSAFTLISGSVTQSLGTIQPTSWDTSSNGAWQIRADEMWFSQYIEVDSSSSCYGEVFIGYDSWLIDTDAPETSIADTMMKIVTANPNTVYFIYPDYQGSKPPGVGHALVTDWSAAGFIAGMCSNSQIDTTDTDPAIINTATGKPKLSNKIIVLLGGPLVNSAVNYYEDNRIAPLYWKGTGSLRWHLADGTELTSTRLTWAEINSGQDVFVVETFIDADGNTVLIVYGNTWQGSFVGGRFFKFVMSMNPTIYDVSWYHFKWIDIDGDEFTDINEVNTTPIASE